MRTINEDDHRRLLDTLQLAEEYLLENGHFLPTPQERALTNALNWAIPNLTDGKRDSLCLRTLSHRW